jgi:hypothetical protein
VKIFPPVLLLMLFFPLFLVSIPQSEVVSAQPIAINIHSDGSIRRTDKIQRNGDIHTSVNISGRIVIQKGNIMLDGAGYALQVNKGEGGKEINLPNGRR